VLFQKIPLLDFIGYHRPSRLSGSHWKELASIECEGNQFNEEEHLNQC